MLQIPSIPREEFRARVRRAQAEMQKDGYDLLLCYGNEAEPQYVRYFSDYWPSFETAGVLIPAQGEALLLIGPESYTYAADRSALPAIRQLKAFRESSEPEYPGKVLETFATVFDEVLHGKKIRRFGVAGLPLMTIGVWEALREVLGGLAIENANDVVNRLRMKKAPCELECMRAAAKITRETFDYVLANIRVGMTEQQVVGLALGKMHELGAERESYPLWVLTGDGSDQAISRPRNKRIEKGDLTFLQIGARVAGYASSIGRPVVFGKATEEQKRLIEAGYRAQTDAIDRLRAGVRAADLARFHIENVTRLGYGDWLLYGPFHGNGTMEGEAPWVETSADFVLEENMTFCADIFLGNHEKKCGLRIEDVVRVTSGEAENLTAYKKELFEL